VGVLLAQGYDAFGVDVLEYWDRDFDKYWLVAEKPPAEVAARLKLVDLANYGLPFEDGTFDFCFSDQVFEQSSTTRRRCRRSSVLKPVRFGPPPSRPQQPDGRTLPLLAVLQPPFTPAPGWGSRHETDWRHRQQLFDTMRLTPSTKAKLPDRPLGRRDIGFTRDESRFAAAALRCAGWQARWIDWLPSPDGVVSAIHDPRRVVSARGEWSGVVLHKASAFRFRKELAILCQSCRRREGRRGAARAS
jgi:hypothetical protein